MDYSGSLTWVSNGGGVVNGNTVTFASGVVTGTKTVIARSAQTHTNAPTCYSAEVTQTAAIQALPATPNLAVSASTVCLGTNITFRVTEPANGAAYTWSGAAGTASGTGDGTYTVSGATTGTKSVTAYARQTSNGTTCQSGNATSSAVVSQPGANGQSSTPCGCATGTSACGNICKTTGTYTTNDGACTGICNKAYVQQRNQCDLVTSPQWSSYDNVACTTGCSAVYDPDCYSNVSYIYNTADCSLKCWNAGYAKYNIMNAGDHGAWFCYCCN
jgi:hypothetical protein